jgi:hypothetical protein
MWGTKYVGVKPKVPALAVHGNGARVARQHSSEYPTCSLRLPFKTWCAAQRKFGQSEIRAIQAGGQFMYQVCWTTAHLVDIN